MNKKSLQIQQLNSKMHQYAALKKIPPPDIGWIRTIRITIGMSMEQLGKRLSMTKQGIQNLELREAEGSITIKSLREVARALDMELVYGFIPKDHTLDQLIERKAKELATQIVLRTNNNMKLEDQENTKQRIEKAIEERTIAIKNEMPKNLWD